MAAPGKEREVKHNAGEMRRDRGLARRFVLGCLGEATQSRWHILLDVTKRGGLWSSPAVGRGAATGAGLDGLII
jgi:hypothetical protein